MAYKFQLGKAKLSGSIETAQVITSQGGLIVNGDVDLDAGVINTAELADLSVTVDKLGAEAVETAKIKALNVTAAKLAADAVETAKIKDLAVTNDKLAGSIASSKIAELNAFDTADLAEGTNLYYTDTRVRAAVSAVDAGGDGSFSYAAGVFTYTGPSAAEARAHVGADGNGIEYASATGVFSLELSGTALQKDANGLRTNITVNTLSPFQNGAVLFNNANGQLDFKPVEESWVRGRLSALNAVKYNSASGSISLQLSGTSLSQNADGLKADLKTKVGGYDNSGSLAYNIANGEFTFSPVAPTWVKGHFSAGAGLDYADGAFSVGTGEVTNAMLAGAIENAKLVNSSVTVTGGNGLSNGGSVALGSSVTLDVQVDTAALEINGSDQVALKSTIAGSRTFSGDVTISGGLTVTGTTTYINTTNLDVADALVKIASGSAGFAADQGIELGGYASLKTALAVADVGNALSSSLPLVAPSMKAASFYGNLVGSMQLGIEAKSADATIAKNITKAMANITLTLPASPVTGQEHRVKCFVADGSSPAVIVAAPVGATIEGVSQVVLESYGAAVSLVWDGSMWMVF
jgi:hypothetical protein